MGHGSKERDSSGKQQQLCEDLGTAARWEGSTRVGAGCIGLG